MTEEKIVSALRELLPDDWRVEHAPCTFHLEVWATSPEEEEWEIAISKSQDWIKGHIQAPWYVRMEVYDVSKWCDSWEEAVEFVKSCLERKK